MAQTQVSDNEVESEEEAIYLGFKQAKQLNYYANFVQKIFQLLTTEIMASRYRDPNDKENSALNS
jgi:hypothetical protein